MFDRPNIDGCDIKWRSMPLYLTMQMRDDQGVIAVENRGNRLLLDRGQAAVAGEEG